MAGIGHSPRNSSKPRSQKDLHLLDVEEISGHDDVELFPLEARGGKLAGRKSPSQSGKIYIECRLNSCANDATMRWTYLGSLLVVTPISATRLEKTHKLSCAPEESSVSVETAQLNLMIGLVSSPHLLKNVATYVIEKQIPYLFIANHMLKRLGIGVDTASAVLAKSYVNYDYATSSSEPVFSVESMAQ